jgi:hypothetical protein
MMTTMDEASSLALPESQFMLVCFRTWIEIRFSWGKISTSIFSSLPRRLDRFRCTTTNEDQHS